MNVKESLTTEDLPRVDWTQHEVVLSEFNIELAFLSIIGIVFIIFAFVNFASGNVLIGSVIIILMIVVALIFATSSSNSLKKYPTSNPKFAYVQIPCFMFVKQTSNTEFQLCYVAGSISRRELKNKGHDYQITDLKQLLSFRVEDAERYLLPAAPPSKYPQQNVVVMDMIEGTSCNVAIHYGGQQDMQRLHTALTRNFNQNPVLRLKLSYASRTDDDVI